MTQEYIVASAVRFEGTIYRGHRHTNIKVAILDALDRYPWKNEEGFVTDRGRFVTRKEAADIAWAAGQLRQKLEFLYSEDIFG
jgi:hypothetical protein